MPQMLFWDKNTCSIGKFCSIASGVKIIGGGEHRSDWVTTYPFSVKPDLFPFAKEVKGHPASKGAVIIGNDVWLGTDACILSGVKIGDGAVIGARAVVVKDVPPYAVVAGNPARISKYRFHEIEIQKLLQIQWWNWDLKKIEQYIDKILCEDMSEFIASVEHEFGEIEIHNSDNKLYTNIIPPINVHTIVPDDLWKLNATFATIISLQRTQCFDEKYYISCYPEVIVTDLNPVEHYVLYGAKQGKNPSPLFDTQAYLKKNTDVDCNIVNPFWHYLRYGYAEGRKNDPVKEAVEKIKSFEQA